MTTLMLICGTSFSGKSTLARHLGERFGYPEVDVDTTKDLLFGSSIHDDALGREDWERIYDETDRQIETHLAAGRSVIDASRNFSKSERHHAGNICRQHDADLLTILVETPEAVTRQRLLANRQSSTRRDVSDQDFAAILASWEAPTPDERPLVLRFGENVLDWIARNTDILANR
jgi:predicted kinase